MRDHDACQLAAKDNSGLLRGGAYTGDNRTPFNTSHGHAAIDKTPTLYEMGNAFAMNIF